MAFNNLMIYDAPPCLAYLYANGKIEERHNYLYNLCIYLKNKYKKPEKYAKFIIKVNSNLESPLPQAELQSILNYVLKHENTYNCGNNPLLRHCNSPECVKRKYGIKPISIKVVIEVKF